jgi:hypothetical protein
MHSLKNKEHAFNKQGKNEIWLGEDPQRFLQDRIGGFKVVLINNVPGWAFLYREFEEPDTVEVVEVVFPYEGFDPKECPLLAMAVTSGELWSLKYGIVRRDKPVRGFKYYKSLTLTTPIKANVVSSEPAPTKDDSLKLRHREAVDVAYQWRDYAGQVERSLATETTNANNMKLRGDYYAVALVVGGILILLIVGAVIWSMN